MEEAQHSGKALAKLGGSAGLRLRRILAAFLQAKLCITTQGWGALRGDKEWRSKIMAVFPSRLLPPGSAPLQAGSSEEKPFCQPPSRAPSGKYAAPPTLGAGFWQTGFLHQHN